jgi:CRP-like cAMP-binding protein
MSRQDLILNIVRCLQPQVSMAGDYIVRVHEIADKMYFIQEGFVEIICTDNVTPIAYFGRGSYFGEVGVLITGKRSVSVRTKTNSV